MSSEFPHQFVHGPLVKFCFGRASSLRCGILTWMVAAGLVGRWRLLSWSNRAGNGANEYPFGERAEGNLVYTPGGWVTVTLAKADRAQLSTDDLVGGGEGERAEAYSSYIAYCGTYEVEGNVVIHRVRMSLFPNWVGSEQVRDFEVSGDELVLRSRVKLGGELVVGELRWIRDE